MRALALLVLLLAQEPDVDALLNQLEDESVEVREKAAAALIEVGPKAEAKLRARIASADGALRTVCTRILETIAVPKELRKVVPPLRRVTMDARPRKLKEVLDDLQGQSGLSLATEGLADGDVTVEMKDATPLEALSILCKAAGLTFYLDGGGRHVRGIVPMGADDKPAIRISRGQYPDVPRQFTRHYVVEPTNLSLTRSTNFQSAQQSNAYLNMRILWNPGMEPEASRLEVASIEDDKGRSLLPKTRGQVEGGRVSEWNRSHGGWGRGGADQNVALLYPEPDAKAIGSIKGTAVMKYVIAETTVLFESPEKLVGEKKESGDLTLEIQEWTLDGDRLTVKLQLTGYKDSADDRGLRTRLDSRHFRMKTEDGSVPQSQGWSGGGGGGTYSMSLNYVGVKSKVLSVEVVVDTKLAEDRFDFELKEIPLPK